MTHGGDRQSSFAEFVRAHTRTLFTTAFLLAGTAERAEDLLQDTLTSLYPKWQLVQDAAQPVAYVRRSVTNRFLNSVRSAGRETPMWDVPESWNGVDLAERVTTSRAIWQALSQLSERQRAAVVLRYFHDLDDHEIAEDLGCRRGTARSLVSRGLAALRTVLDENTSGHSDQGAQR